MATSVQIHLTDYLHTSFRPDREYIDGELSERNGGKFEHSRIQALLAIWFGTREHSTNLMVFTEQRVQVSPTRVRIPDVILVPMGAHPEILVHPTALVIEILSPDDTYADTQRRADDYARLGVTTIWIIDPQSVPAGSVRAIRGSKPRNSPRAAVPFRSVSLHSSTPSNARRSEWRKARHPAYDVSRNQSKRHRSNASDAHRASVRNRVKHGTNRV